MDMTNIEANAGGGFVDLQKLDLPAWYRCKVVAEETKEAKSGATMLVIRFEVVDGPAEGVAWLQNFMLADTNPKAIEIARRHLGQIKAAINPQMRQSSEMVGRALDVRCDLDYGGGQYDDRLKAVRFAVAGDYSAAGGSRKRVRASRRMSGSIRHRHRGTRRRCTAIRSRTRRSRTTSKTTSRSEVTTMECTNGCEWGPFGPRNYRHGIPWMWFRCSGCGRETTRWLTQETAKAASYNEHTTLGDHHRRAD